MQPFTCSSYLKSAVRYHSRKYSVCVMGGGGGGGRVRGWGSRDHKITELVWEKIGNSLDGGAIGGDMDIFWNHILNAPLNEIFLPI